MVYEQGFDHGAHRGRLTKRDKIVAGRCCVTREGGAYMYSLLVTVADPNSSNLLRALRES